jgi:hypothetical protein
MATYNADDIGKGNIKAIGRDDEVTVVFPDGDELYFKKIDMNKE